MPRSCQILNSLRKVSELWMLVTKLRKIQRLSWVNWSSCRIPLLIFVSQLEMKTQGQHTNEAREAAANRTSLDKIGSLETG